MGEEGELGLLLADHLRPLRNKPRVKNPTIRQVVSVTAGLGGVDKLTSVREARQHILKWLSMRVGNLPTEAWDGKTFEHMSPGRFAAGVLIEIPNGEYWTVRCDDPDKTIPGRTWTTEISLARQESVANFGLRLVVASTEVEVNYVPAIPGIVRQLVESPGLTRNDRALSADPLIVDTDEKLDAFVDLLTDRRRRNPVFVISLDENEENPAMAIIDPHNLATRCLGIAHTVVITGPQAFRLSDHVGKSFSVFRRAVRTYRSGLSLDDDPYRHPLALAGQIAEWQDKGPGAFINTLIWTAARNSTISVDEAKDLPPFTKAKQIALQIQRETALRESDYPALLALADNELKEKQREIAALESMVVDEEIKREDLEGRLMELSSSNSFLRSRVVDLENNITEASPQNIISPSPTTYDAIGDWADAAFAGRVKLTARARRDIKDAEFADVDLVARCIRYLGTEFWKMKTLGGIELLQGNERALADLAIKNESSGSEHLLREQGETFLVQWGASNRKRLLDMHLKNGGNTRDPARCLRIYYFWDDDTQQVVVGSLPAHLSTRAS